MTVGIRPFAARDLPGAVRFCDRARALDPGVEPFSMKLPALAAGGRARLDLWRVAEDERDDVCGIAFAALRESGTVSAVPWFDVYAAVDPSVRRRGTGSSLCGAMLAEPAALRARVHEGSAPGRAFLRSLGFEEKSVQLSMMWSARALDARAAPSLRIRRAHRDDTSLLEMLSRDAWVGSPEIFSSRPEDVGRFFAEGQIALVAEADSGPGGYVLGAWLGRALAIEEVAVLPTLRRSGIGRALLVEAMRPASHAMLTVAEANHAARALYRSLGFSNSARRIVCERRPGRR